MMKKQIHTATVPIQFDETTMKFPMTMQNVIRNAILLTTTHFFPLSSSSAPPAAATSKRVCYFILLLYLTCAVLKKKLKCLLLKLRIHAIRTCSWH